jgi:hypothetical protein
LAAFENFKKMKFIHLYQYFIFHILLHVSSVIAVSDGQLEPPSMTKWFCGIGSVLFVYLILPFWGRNGVDPVIAYVVCWTIMGCWVLYGIAN